MGADIPRPAVPKQQAVIMLTEVAIEERGMR